MNIERLILKTINLFRVTLIEAERLYMRLRYSDWSKGRLFGLILRAIVYNQIIWMTIVKFLSNNDRSGTIQILVERTIVFWNTGVIWLTIYNFKVTGSLRGRLFNYVEIQFNLQLICIEKKSYLERRCIDHSREILFKYIWYIWFEWR